MFGYNKASYNRIRAHEEANLKKFSDLLKEKKTKLAEHKAGRGDLTEDVSFTVVRYRYYA